MFAYCLSNPIIEFDSYGKSVIRPCYVLINDRGSRKAETKAPIADAALIALSCSDALAYSVVWIPERRYVSNPIFCTINNIVDAICCN